MEDEIRWLPRKTVAAACERGAILVRIWNYILNFIKKESPQT